MNQPKPFGKLNTNILAFVLGCDPTAFTKTEKVKKPEEREHLVFDMVFDIKIGVKNKYFARILANLKQINMDMYDIYVQNLVTDYQKEESSKNKAWVKIAQDFILPRMEEFDNIDPSRKIPVLLTSELLYKALLNKAEKRITAKQFYDLTVDIPISAAVNQLRRPLIPFYRHPAYNLKNKREYAQQMKAIL